MANETWMTEFTDRDDLTLGDITMPSSHDAGVTASEGGYAPYWFVAKVAKRSTVAQEGSIGDQLIAGARFFDLRIGLHNGEARTFHGEGIATPFGGWGHKAEDVFRHVNAFLEMHTGEIVILRISHTEKKVNIGQVVQETIDLDRRFCISGNVALKPLALMRGKAVVIIEKKGLSAPAQNSGLHHFAKYGTGFSDNAQTRMTFPGLVTCGEYSGTFANMSKVAKDTILNGNAHSKHPKIAGKQSHLFMAYWQLTLNIEAKTKAGLDEGTDGTRLHVDRGPHANLDYLLNLHRGFNSDDMGVPRKSQTYYSEVRPQNRLDFRPNIINLDFVDAQTCSKIIEFNNALLPPR